MKNILTTLIISALALNLSAQDNLEGFLYGQASSPDGTEWQSPERLSLNKLQPRAHIFPFANAAAARSVLPEGSKYFQSLDGIWKFHWSANPDQRPKGFADSSYDVKGWDDIEVPGCWNVQGLGRHGEMKYGVPIYVNQPVIFYHEVKKDDWREGVMREPKDQRWTTYKYRNEVGSYRRNFTIPADWRGRQVILNFDGVDSFFYLWVNGRYVGFSKNSRNTARFDITNYLKEDGENSLAVEVYRNSDGSFLEAQDMFRLPGIFRSTYLTAFPQVQIADLAVRTMQLGEEEAVVQVDGKVNNLSQKVLKGLTMSYSIYPVRLYSDETSEAAGQLSDVVEAIKGGEAAAWQTSFNIEKPLPWSAEKPNRYVLVAELKDKKGRLLDCTSTYFGIRTVEIRETKAAEDEFGLAGRYFYVNGKPVKLKGVNRHETNPSTGHAITRDQMLEEVKLMKRGNINHVRLSHYSNDPYFYYLADKYGLYLEDEANIESHEYYYGEASLSHPQEWRAAHVARNMEAVKAHVNHPSIVIWSLGNEAGPGDNFKAAYEAIKAFDQSRPVQYERNNDIVDMGSNQYPSVDWVRFAVKGTGKGIKYPYHISEYAHSMGNSLGNLIDYWEAIESTNFFCGAAIWDWVDQAIDTYKADDGTKYFGYGGDHGDWPNDGMFCMNGIMLPDLSPKPQYYEVKKVYQNVGVTLDEVREVHGKKVADFTVFNKNYFEPISSREYDVVAYLVVDGEKQAELPISWSEDIWPRKQMRCVCPVDMSRGGEYFLNVEFRLKHDMPWAEKGYVQMAEQLFLLDTSSQNWNVSFPRGTQQVKNEGGKVVVKGKDHIITFDNRTGSLCGMQQGGKVFFENSPLQLSAFRAPVDNDNWARDQWFQQGLYALQHRAVGNPVVSKSPDGVVLVSYTVESQAAGRGGAKHRPGKAGQPYESVAEATGQGETVSFTSKVVYRVYPDGKVVLASSIITSDPDLPLPRLGYEMKLPSRFDRYTYYGRGPLNNYNDRKSGSFVGIYESTVQEQFVSFPKPQSMGNREDVRWCALRDGQGDGLLFVSELGTMSTSALPWSALQLTKAQHPHELPASDGTYLHLDCKVNGMGGNSCGQGGPLKKDRVLGALHQMKLLIAPVGEGDELSGTSAVRRSHLCPVAILRDKAGKVTIVGDTYDSGETPSVLYRIAGGKPQKYTEPFDFKQGGTVVAWYEKSAAIKTSATFEKIEKVPVEVVYVSSEEGPGGEYGKNLVDGDPSTIWHTMYSITVPKYPHWVDFDCGEEKLIKGFTYLPRQDGSPNGNIKAYKVQLSSDGKTWAEPVSEGSFDGSAKEKKVLFDKPQRARYLRFTAQSSQNGADFASGAEFNVLAE
ncbi:MAG: discoidin domain-containing protein [Bacteroidaceae bacterium]|nr:discoidin domain-containing protein [Bacteroidaceae bacterium]